MAFDPPYDVTLDPIQPEVQDLINKCVSKSFSFQLTDELQNLVQSVECTLGIVGFVMESPRAAKFNELTSSASAQAAWSSLLATLTEANVYLAGAKFISQKVLLIGDVEIHPEISSENPTAALERVIQRLKTFSKTITCYSELFKTIYDGISPSDLDQENVWSFFKQVQDTNKTLEAAFIRHPFNITWETAQMAIKRLAREHPNPVLKFRLLSLNDGRWSAEFDGEAEFDKRFDGLKKHGEDWVANGIMPDKPDFWLVLQDLLKRYNPHPSPELKSPGWIQEEKRLQNAIIEFKSSSTGVTKAHEVTKLRMAICGPTSSGKSTIINALTGTNIIHTSRRASTAWPVLLRHDPSLEEPSLSVTPAHFDPFVGRLRDAQGDKLQKFIGSLEPETVAHLHLFRDPEYRLSPDAISGADKINEELSRIDDLIRLSYKVSSIEDRPQQETQDWPTISINMENLKNLPCELELLDLPGFTDRDIPQGDLQAQIESALCKCDAIILVLKAQADTVDDESINTYMRFLSSVARVTRKPLLVVGTHLDWKNPWTPAAEEKIQQTLWPDKAKRTQIVVCSPLRYISARMVENKLTTSSTMPDFDTLKQGDGELALNNIFGELPHLQNKFWNAAKKEDVLEDIQSELSKSEFASVIDRIQYKLALGAQHRRLSSVVGTIGDSFTKLKQEYRIVLDLACQTSEKLDDIEREISDLKKACMAICARWEVSKLQLLSDLQKEPTLCLNRWWDKADAAVCGLLPGLKELDKDEIERKIISTLDTTQLQMVTEIRIMASDIWAKRFESLLSHLLKQGNETRLRAHILEKVKQHILPLTKRPLEETVKKLLEAIDAEQVEGSLLLQARQTAEAQLFERSVEDQTMKKSALEHFKQSIGQSLGFKHSIRRLKTAEAKKYKMIAMNELGFLLRPASLIAANCLNLSSESVQMLAKGSEPSNLREILRKSCIVPWRNFFKEECEKSLRGVVLLSSIIGTQMTEETLEAQLKLIQAKLQIQGPLDEKSVESLIVEHCNCVSASFAVEEIQRQLSSCVDREWKSN